MFHHFLQIWFPGPQMWVGKLGYLVFKVASTQKLLLLQEEKLVFSFYSKNNEIRVLAFFENLVSRTSNVGWKIGLFGF